MAAVLQTAFSNVIAWKKILIPISLKFVSEGHNDDKSALIQAVVDHWTGTNTSTDDGSTQLIKFVVT